MLGLILRKLPAPIRGLLLLAAGGYLVWGGIRSWTGPARCDGKEMPAGSTCMRSDGTMRSVAEMLHNQHTHAWAPFLTGLLILALGVGTLMWPTRLRN